METRKLKRQQRTVGAIVKIPLENDFWTYARILEVKMAFYDAKTNQDLEISEIVQKPVLFFATVYDSAITKGFWEKIGKKLPLENHLLDLPPIYRQDILNPKRFWIHHKNQVLEVDREACLGLEVMATWNYENIEKRLNDHYAKRPNDFVDYMKNADMHNYFHRNTKNYANTTI